MKTSYLQAGNIEEMRQIGRNQIQMKIWELQERIEKLEWASTQVDSIVGWDSWNKVWAEIEDDAQDLKALHVLGDEYETMKQGYYF